MICMKQFVNLMMSYHMEHQLSLFLTFSEEIQ